MWELPRPGSPLRNYGWFFTPAFQLLAGKAMEGNKAGFVISFYLRGQEYQFNSIKIMLNQNWAQISDLQQNASIKLI